MNKTLYLLRHASAEEGSVHFRDFERELTSSGIMETARVGEYLKTVEPAIQKIYCSSSHRTLNTAVYVAERLHIPASEIMSSEDLYSGGARAYLKTINEIPENTEVVLLVGHNPDISFFAEYLTKADIGGSLLKASLVRIDFADISWAEISGKTGSFVLRKDVTQAGS